jgi:hypothetical protein
MAPSLFETPLALSSPTCEIRDFHFQPAMKMRAQQRCPGGWSAKNLFYNTFGSAHLNATRLQPVWAVVYHDNGETEPTEKLFLFITVNLLSHFYPYLLCPLPSTFSQRLRLVISSLDFAD